ncbi:MAG: hypothetical protein ACJ768_19580 [Gaiellaceae bacterium]
MRIKILLLAGAAIALLALSCGAYAAGRSRGRAESSKAAGAAELARLRRVIIERDKERAWRELALRHDREQLDSSRAAVATTAAAHQVARRRVELVDSTHARVDGILEQLPAPVVQLTLASDARIRADSVHIVRLELYAVSLEEWGNLWKAQADDYRRRGELLEAQLAHEKRRGRWVRIRDVSLAVLAGAAGGVLLAR